MSLRVYAQPLVASGDYSDIKGLVLSRSFEFSIYGKDTGTYGPHDRLDRPEGAGPAVRFVVLR